MSKDIERQRECFRWARSSAQIACAIAFALAMLFAYAGQPVSAYAEQDSASGDMNLASAELILDDGETTFLIQAVPSGGIGAPSTNALFTQGTALSPQSVNDTFTIKGEADYNNAAKVLQIVNRERGKSGVSALKMDKTLQDAAMLRAFETGMYFSHTRPNGQSCFTASSKMDGENIAYGPYRESAAAEAIMNQWMNSAGHRANILSSRFRSIGIGCFHFGNLYYFVQCFSSSPASGSAGSGKVTRTYKIGVLYNTISPNNLGFNLRVRQSNPEPLMSGGKYTLELGLRNAGTGSTYVAIDPSTCKWTSSNSRVCGVTSNGIVTGGQSGTATITARTPGGKTITKKFKVEANVNMHRLYNPNSGEHFYTASVQERDNLTKIGWRYEGIGWKAPTLSKTPVYRLYNPNSGDHHYTVSAAERDNLVRIGWRYEGVGWRSDDAKGMPLYRQFNPNEVIGTHNYTTSKQENDHLVSIGWRGEGIAWYGVK